MPGKLPEHTPSGARSRSFGDGGLDNSAAQNKGYASDKGGVVNKKNPSSGYGRKPVRDTKTGNRGMENC